MFYIANPICGENEYYSECGDNGCQKKCPDVENIYKKGLSLRKRPNTCRPKCSTGACICKPGFVRDPDGACVDPEDCRK